MRDSYSGMQWQCYSWRRRPDTRFQACQLTLQMWSFVDSMPRLVLLQYPDSPPTNMSRNLDGDVQYFSVSSTWQSILENPIHGMSFREADQGMRHKAMSYRRRRWAQLVSLCFDERTLAQNPYAVVGDTSSCELPHCTIWGGAYLWRITTLNTLLNGISGS